MNDVPPNDSELLRRFATGRSEAAFATFVERRIGFVYGIALRRTTGDTHLASEISQNVFLITSQKAASLSRHACLSGWLHTTTSHVARRMLRDATLRRQREQEAAAMNELHNNAALAGQKHMREILDEALDSLGQKDREALLLRFFETRTFAEVALATNTNEDAARMRVTRALDKMRAIFGRRGITTTAAALGTFITAEAAAAAPAGLATAVSGAILAGGAATLATTTATTGGVLAFMTSTKIAVIATAAALVMATVVTVEVLREKSAANDLASLKREHAALLKKLGDTQTQVKRRQTSLSNFRRQKTEVAEYAKNPHKLDPIEAGKALLAQHPEIHAMLFDRRSATLANKYFSARKKLNLTREQFAEVVDLIAKSGSVMIGPQAFTPGNIPGFGQVTFVTGPHAGPYAQDQEAYDKLKEMVGGVDGLKALSMSGGQSEEEAQSLAKNLYYTETPLTADQMTQFIQLIHAHREKGETDWNAVQKHAGSFLSAPQMAALQQRSGQSVLQDEESKIRHAAALEEGQRTYSGTGASQ